MFKILNRRFNYFTIRTFGTTAWKKSEFRDSLIEISDEVMFALQKKRPVVALESTIITHGMPFPENIQCATNVESVVRSQGAIPATVAIIKGKIKVGLDDQTLQQLGDVSISKPVKTSRRDLAYVVSNQLSGGTTVSGTLVVAHRVGIPIFATGGIGGVHRGAETTFDVSADLTELSKSNVAVVSSGVKSILDIPKTLEYLETQGVFVASFGKTKDFPAFYTRKSGCFAPYKVENALEAAKIIHHSDELRMNSGMIFAVPIPQDYSLDEQEINEIISNALKLAKENGVTGKDVTPFLLAHISKVTGGKSLKSNVALMKNNAKTAADIAVELAQLRNQEETFEPLASTGQNQAVVIGGSNLDCCAQLKEPEIKMDGRIHDCKFSYSAGGVARNISEAMSKMGHVPVFISAVGDDQPGNFLKSKIPTECNQNVITVPNQSTAQCTVVLDSTGDCNFILGDMGIHRVITPDVIKKYEEQIRRAPLVVFDGNLSPECMNKILELAEKHKTPVFFEPTDVEISSKPFSKKTLHSKAIKYITPNFAELKHLSHHFGLERTTGDKSVIEESATLARFMVAYVDNVIVTLGSNGLIIARKAAADEKFLSPTSTTDEVQVRHYPARNVKSMVNVSGAGDSLASGLIIGMLMGRSEEVCVSIGMDAAVAALASKSTVAELLVDYRDRDFDFSATYNRVY